jgi:hypothetical protein
MAAVMERIKNLKDAGEDFEWYPTTDAIINKVANRIMQSMYRGGRSCSILDIGAGDGRVLVKIKQKLEADRCDCEAFAIEKSSVHLKEMPKEIVVIGTDFLEQSLLDKDVGYIFCNPPYSEYEEWTRKVLRESKAEDIYMVIPTRWRDSDDLNRSIKSRGYEVESLGEFDFENADRRARAKVEVVRFNRDISSYKDPFDTILEEMLPDLNVFDRDEHLEEAIDAGANVREAGGSMIESLVAAYDAEVTKLIENYGGVLKLDINILKELGVTKASVLQGIRQKITGLKTKYWEALFHNFAPITQRLATKQRKAFLESLHGKAIIDFTEGNVLSMLIWITKWANDHFDTQLIELFKAMAEDCNVARYKSNQRVWTKGWRYMRGEEMPTHWKLEYRIVMSRGGINTSQWEWERKQHNGLCPSSFEMLQDIVTVANNLGFACDDSPKDYQWESNKQVHLKLEDGSTLAAVRAFKNGNMHIHFNQKFILAVNVEAGRLLGWLNSPAEAVDELQVTGKDAEFVQEKFGGSFRITSNSIPKLIFRS